MNTDVRRKWVPKSQGFETATPLAGLVSPNDMGFRFALRRPQLAAAASKGR
jgi:hypothetical protein